MKTRCFRCESQVLPPRACIDCYRIREKRGRERHAEKLMIGLRNYRECDEAPDAFRVVNACRIAVLRQCDLNENSKKHYGRFWEAHRAFLSVRRKLKKEGLV